MISALAITGMTFTLLSRFFIVSKSNDLSLKKHPFYLHSP